MANRLAVWGMAAVLALRAAASPAQQTYRDENLHWEADLPAGWVSAPEIAAAATDLVRSRAPGSNLSYLASFRSPGSAYIIFQFTPWPMRTMDLDTLESQLGTDMKHGQSELQDKFSDVISKAEFGKPVLDRVGKRIITRMQMTDKTGNALEALLVGHLTKDGVVQVNCYAPANEFGRYEPVFESISSSIRIDPAAAYAPPPPAPAPLGGVGLLRVAAIGAVGGLVIGLWLEVVRRLKARSANA